MELKTARLTLLIDPKKKAAFERVCAQQDRTVSQVVRQFIRDYLAKHGVDTLSEGLDAPSEASAEVKRSPQTPRKAARATVQPGSKTSKLASRAGARHRQR